MSKAQGAAPARKALRENVTRYMTVINKASGKPKAIRKPQ